MLKNLANLISVKKLIALSLTGTFITLSITGQIKATEFMTVFLMIVSFYFGQSTARQSVIDKKDNS